MATNEPAKLGRRLALQAVHYLRRDFTFADTGELVVGILPAGAVMLKPLSGVSVHTAFNNGTTNTLNVGTTADDNLYGTALATGSIAFVPLDEAVSQRVDAETTITITQAVSGTAATAGEATAVIAYLVDNDR